jgi:hypothetical protein
MMADRAERCENCGNPVLVTDTVCWHCGWQLPQRPRPKAAAGGRSFNLNLPAPLLAAAERETAAPEPYQWRAIAVYGLLTMTIIVALVVVMHALGRRPLLVSSANLRLGANWTAVTDNQLRYTLSLPPDWQWLDGAFRQQQGVVDDLVRREPVIAWSLTPLGRLGGELAILAVGSLPQLPESEERLTFVVVGHSPQLGELPPQAALAQLAEHVPPISGAELVEALPGQPQARFGLLDDGRGYQCRMLFSPQATAAYVLAACAPQERFGLVQGDLNKILDSFQLIQP